LPQSTKLTRACNLSCSHCLAKGTLMLLTDGSWKPIESVEVGDRLVSWELDAVEGKKYRRYVDTEVIRLIRKRERLIRITTTAGEVKSTPDHEWLVKRQDRHCVVRTRDLRVGDAFLHLCDPVKEDITQDSDYRAGWLSGVSFGDGSWGDYVCKRGPVSTFKVYSKDQELLDRVELYAKSLFGVELSRVHHKRKDTGAELSYSHLTRVHRNDDLTALMDLAETPPMGRSTPFIKGWLAGMFDAEGTRNGLGICQKEQEAIDEVRYCWEKLGFDVRIAQKADDSWWVYMRGGRPEVARFASLCRPALTRKVAITGAVSKTPRAQITAIEPMGHKRDPEVYDVETTSKTFVAGGFLSVDCYQNTARDLGNVKKAHDYDIHAAIRAINAQWDWEEENRGGAAVATAHGGEPLLIKKADLEEIFRINHERFGKAAIQTNGVLVDDDHMAMFKRYNVNVGLSIDGWGRLNDVRKMGNTLRTTLEGTAATLRTLLRLCREHRPPGLIICLTKANAGPGLVPGQNRRKIDELKRFIDWLADHGIRNPRLNPAHIDTEPERSDWELSETDMAAFWAEFVPWSLSRGYQFPAIAETMDGLLGCGQFTCVRTQCDPLHTAAERTIQEDSAIGVCEHLYAAGGIPYQVAEDKKFSEARYEILRGVSHEHGGCLGGVDGRDGDQVCRWWAVCTGHCNGHAIDGDWRNRTRFCRGWAGLYQAVADHLHRTIPNLTTLDQVAHRFDANGLYHSIQQNEPPWDPFRWLRKANTYRPSAWRGEAKNSEFVRTEDAPVGNPCQLKLVDPNDPAHANVAHGNYDDHGDHADAAHQKNPLEHANVPHGNYDDHGDSNG